MRSASSSVAVGVVHAEDRARLARDLGDVRERLPAHVALVAGGRAAVRAGDELAGCGIVVGDSLDALCAVLRGRGRLVATAAR